MEETLRTETVLMETKGEINDMMSELPNCLLAFILSLLSLKDAVKTSVLSRRWRHLFMLIPDLVVDSSNIFSDDEDHRRFTLSSYAAFEKERREFVMRVDKFMMQQLLRKRHIRSLTVGFFMDTEYSSHLDSWLKVAIASGLTKLELFLSLEQNFLTPFIVNKHRLYNFPYWLFSESNTSILSHLRLENCVLRTPGDFKGFRNLRTLELKDVILAEDFATEILPSCLLLEQLTFLWCKLKSALCFDHPSLSLKHLKVLHCCPETIIKISSMTLTTFEYDYMMKIAYLYAPQLKEICSTNTRGPLSFAHFSRLPQLEILLLYVDYLQIQNIPTSLDTMASLKKLSLFLVSADDDFDLSWVITVLKAVPLLQKLVLTLHGGERNADQKEIGKLEGVNHDELKEFEMHGCVGNWYEMELQLFVLSRASRLKRLIISPSTSMYAGNGRWVDIYEGARCWNPSCLEMVRNQLEGQVPHGVQLVFL